MPGGPVPVLVPVLVAAVLPVVVLRADPAPLPPSRSEPKASAPATVVPPVEPGRYRPPTPRPVSRGFDAPGRYQAGNRGLDYATAAGDVVSAVGAGTVVFAGPVAGAVWVTVLHPDGLRSSLGPLATLDVSAGQPVARGSRLGTVAGPLHLGVRRGEQYVDPAALFGPRHARLVPVGARLAPG